jgi:outer membrane protein
MRSFFSAAAAALAFTAVASVADAQAQKIAYVNTQALMEVAPGKAAADSALAKESEGYRAQLQKMQDSLNSMFTNYTKKEPTLSAAQKETQQKAIQSFETDLQAKQLQLEQQFAQRRNEVYAPITEAVKRVLDGIRSEDGYAIIFANDPGQSPIVSADKNLDITDRVVARLRTVKAAPIAAPGSSKTAPTAPAGVTRPPPKPPTA